MITSRSNDASNLKNVARYTRFGRPVCIPGTDDNQKRRLFRGNKNKIGNGQDSPKTWTLKKLIEKELQPSKECM